MRILAILRKFARAKKTFFELAHRQFFGFFSLQKIYTKYGIFFVIRNPQNFLVIEKKSFGFYSSARGQ